MSSNLELKKKGYYLKDNLQLLFYFLKYDKGSTASISANVADKFQLELTLLKSSSWFTSNTIHHHEKMLFVIAFYIIE